MTQLREGWGSGPSARYEALAQAFRPIFERIRATAVARDLERRLPADEIGWLRQAGFPKLRLPVAQGGFQATLPELYNLLIELSAADSNVTNALRTHFGFTERVLVSTDSSWRSRWIGRVAAGETFGGAYTEAGDAKLGSFSTRLVREGAGWRLSGEKYYTTGCLFADWLMTAVAAEEDSDIKVVLAARRAPGVEVIDDWNGFGQALTASGTTRFRDVAIAAEAIVPNEPPLRYGAAFYQLVHIATLTGIARAAADDAVRLVAGRTRVFSNANAARAGADPQILQVVGRVRALAYSAGAITLKAAEAIQRVYDAYGESDEAVETEGTLSDVEINQAVSVVTNLVLEATTILFDALGASATARDMGLDRYWRNARTITSHNPRIYRERSVGDWIVNGAKPPTAYRVGVPDAEPHASSQVSDARERKET